MNDYQIDERIRQLEMEITRLRNLKFYAQQNRNYRGERNADYQSQHYFNESQSDYFGKWSTKEKRK